MWGRYLRVALAALLSFIVFSRSTLADGQIEFAGIWTWSASDAEITLTAELGVWIAANGANNVLRRVWLGDPRTAVIEVGGQQYHSATWIEPLEVGGLVFRLQRIGPGDVYLPLVVTDGCGDWPSFVGASAANW